MFFRERLEFSIEVPVSRHAAGAACLRQQPLESQKGVFADKVAFHEVVDRALLCVAAIHEKPNDLRHRGGIRRRFPVGHEPQDLPVLT